MIELEPKTRAMLDRIRHSTRVLSIYEMPADLADTPDGQGDRFVSSTSSGFAVIKPEESEA